MKEVMPKMKYCIKCGGLEVDENGNPCECVKVVTDAYDAISCMEIPEQYRGVIFTKELLPMDIDHSYGEFMASIYSDIVRGLIPKENYLIASPIGHGKTILAYSCIERLFRNGYPILPVYDVLELVNIMLNFDMGRKQVYDVEHPEYITEIPVLFAKIPRVSRYDVFDAISMILDRRVRHGGITIFLFDGTYQYLTGMDRNDILEGLAGNGHYTTFKVKSWASNKMHVDVEPKGNIG